MQSLRFILLFQSAIVMAGCNCRFQDNEGDKEYLTSILKEQVRLNDNFSQEIGSMQICIASDGITMSRRGDIQVKYTIHLVPNNVRGNSEHVVEGASIATPSNEFSEELDVTFPLEVPAEIFSGSANAPGAAQVNVPKPSRVIVAWYIIRIDDKHGTAKLRRATPKADMFIFRTTL